MTVVSGKSQADSKSQSRNSFHGRGGAGFGRLIEVVTHAQSQADAYQTLLNSLMKQPGHVAIGFFRPGSAETVECVTHNFTGPVFEGTGFTEVVQRLAKATIQSGQQCSEPVEQIRNLTVISIPIPVADDSFHALCAGITNRTGSNVDAPLHTAATLAAMWHQHDAHQQLRLHLATTAAVLELTEQIEGASGFRAGCLTLVNSLKEHFGCQSVVLGIQRKSESSCRVTAVSGMPEFDPRAEQTAQIEQALEECLVRDRLSVYPATHSSGKDSLLCHRQLARTLHATRITSHPLVTTGGDSIGVLLVVDEELTANSTKPATFLEAASGRLATSLQIARRADSSVFTRQRQKSKLQSWPLRIACLVCVIWVILMIPVTDQVHCECSAQPDIRTFVVAPHEGLLQQAFAHPGDVVEAGQRLAVMDGQKVRWELAGLTAEYEQAKKEQDAGLLAGDVAASQRASLERQQLDARRQILQQQLTELEIASPTTGIVLEGHLDRVENAPVSIGQALYEIAPLSPVTVEIRIPDSDFQNVQPGNDVVIRFDGLSNEFTGTLQKVSPQSEVIDGQNVFIADVTFANDDQRLRPGMKGYACVFGRKASLGWSLFHKPWEHFRRSMPF